jgi:hypothetical protein
MSSTREYACEQLAFLEAETFGECDARPFGDANPETTWLAGAANLGT